MALIKTDYDLSGGAVDSDEVATPNNWRVTVTTTGCPAKQDVFFDFYVEDAQGNWAVLTDDNDKPISMRVRGNDVKSINPIVVNASNGIVRTVPPSGATGTVNIDSINA